MALTRCHHALAAAGWFTDPSPFLEGGLEADDIIQPLDDAFASLGDSLDLEGACCTANSAWVGGPRQLSASLAVISCALAIHALRLC